MDNIGQVFVIVLLIVLVVFVLTVLARSIRIIPQASAGVVERLGKYHKTLSPGLNLLVPFIDRVRPLIDLAALYSKGSGGGCAAAAEEARAWEQVL